MAAWAAARIARLVLDRPQRLEEAALGQRLHHDRSPPGTRTRAASRQGGGAGPGRDAGR